MPTLEQDATGRWVRAIPEPLWVGFGLRKAQCNCGQRFRGKRRTGETARERYREHHRAKHGGGR